MRLEELKEASYHGRQDLERLLDAVANAYSFIGYEASHASKVKTELDAAFKDITGMHWYEWQDAKEQK